MLTTIGNDQHHELDNNTNEVGYEEDGENFQIYEKSGLLAGIRRNKVLIGQLLQQGDTVFDLVEKLSKLIYWENQKASTIMLFVLLIAFFVVTFIPIRGILLVWAVAKFNKGSRYYQRRYVSNRECCRIELRNFFLEHKLYSFDVLNGDETKWLSQNWPKEIEFDQLKEKF